MPFEREPVRSAQNQYVSLARALGERKFRRKNRLFRFDGVKLFAEALHHGAALEFILLSESQGEEALRKALSLYGVAEEEIACPMIPVADHIFERLTEENAPEGIIGVAKYMEEKHRNVADSAVLCTLGQEKLLLLESVRDPLNVGATLRVAAAFGVDRVLMGSDCADIYNSKTLRASMGTLFGMHIDIVEDIPSAVRILRESGRRVFAAALDSKAARLGTFPHEAGDCVLIGNEGHGLSREAIEACGQSVYIPMAEGVESLNAATAAAVLVWEFFGK